MSSSDVHVVFLYNKYSKYSVNAIVATVDTLKGVRVNLVENLEKMVEISYVVRTRGYKCIAAFSLLTTMLATNGFYAKLKDAVGKLKQMGCITVCGGPHASGDPVGACLYFGFDYVVVGEGEESFKELVLATRDNLDPRNVKGIVYSDHGKIVYTGRRDQVDLDRYPPFPYWRGIFNPIEITRGCPYGCFYCQVSYMHGFNYRHRSVDAVSFYVEEFLKKGGRDIRFVSPSGLAYGASSAPKRGVNVEAIETLLQAVVKIAGKYCGRVFLGSFPSEVRPDHVTEDSMKLLKKYVCNKAIIIGAQSGSQRILKAIGRGHTVGDVLNAVEIATKYGFEPHVDVILGIPGESEEDMRETLSLAKKIVELGGKIHLHHYIPLPGTPLGLKRPALIPLQIRKDFARIVGMGKGYGKWSEQEKLAQSILELHYKGVIAPRA